jgi:acylphosphatase
VEANRIRRHLIVRGRVQGVAFRASTRQQAQRLGVDGWVRNRADGTVEAVLEGPADAVERLEAWCHQGPDWAQVAHVEAGDAPAQELRGFEIR